MKPVTVYRNLHGPLTKILRVVAVAATPTPTPTATFTSTSTSNSTSTSTSASASYSLLQAPSDSTSHSPSRSRSSSRSCSRSRSRSSSRSCSRSRSRSRSRLHPRSQSSSCPKFGSFCRTLREELTKRKPTLIEKRILQTFDVLTEEQLRIVDSLTIRPTSVEQLLVKVGVDLNTRILHLASAERGLITQAVRLFVFVLFSHIMLFM